MQESGDATIAQAENSSGRIKVLKDRVRIERNFYIPGHTSGTEELAFGRIGEVRFKKPSG